MVNATNPESNSSDTTSQGGEMERKKYKNTRMMALQRMNRLKIKKNGIYEIQDHTSRSTTTMNMSTQKSERQV